MASGWAKDGAVQDQIDDSVAEALERVRSRLPAGAGRTHCEECGEEIAAARRAALPGVRRCIVCQTRRDQEPHGFSSYNRRGSKDSQLR